MKYITRTITKTSVTGTVITKDETGIKQEEFVTTLIGEYDDILAEVHLDEQNKGAKFFVTGVEVINEKRRMDYETFLELSELVEPKEKSTETEETETEIETDIETDTEEK